jgi:glycosyltransferase involved in cell wall biosynthesis
MKVSGVILSFNEEKYIGPCIDSLLQVADEVIVLDSFSSDNTLDIARNKGAIIRQSPFDGYINQKNKALKLATHDHLILLDADEILSPGLIRSILREKQSLLYTAYSMNRSTQLAGTFIRHGLWYPDRKIRFFDRRLVSFSGFDPHDKIIFSREVNTKHLSGDLLHFAFDSIAEYMHRNEEVSTVMALSLFEAGIKTPSYKILLSPAWAFINGYFLKRGFLHGYKGFIIACGTSKQSFRKYYKLRKLHRPGQKQMVWQ